ncbi:MAG: histidine phosphatase family protein [Flavobacteriales bacterium]|jgi:phosphohistidine phosphatase|nr:histidine phosphatase family protein [Flavobacteriales bacterium]MBL1232905.1 histidine phosphatase family protein [Flavobacteriales bacterium]|tara:strand:+ start:205913 stop:206407 length:495 start_codon:yes stop_codon:yes gene_type:complete
MKTIYLIRHAKSSWENHRLSDFERPLNTRGINDTEIIGKELNKLNFNPEKIIASTSVRTTATIQLLCEHINYNFKHVIFNSKLYHPSKENFIRVLEDLPDELESVALVSHNYGISEFADYLTENFMEAMPTCAVVCIALEIDSWKEIVKGLGTTKWYIYPKMLA